MADKILIKHKKKTNVTNVDKNRNKIWQILFLIILICLVVFMVQKPVLNMKGSFTDDDQYLLRNALVRSPGIESVSKFLSEILNPSTVKGYYQPLTMISLMTDFWLAQNKDDVGVFHRTSLILHILNTVLIALILYKLFDRLLSSVFVALLFGIHPMTVEVIVWVAERKTSLATFFALCSVLFYILYTRRIEINMTHLSNRGTKKGAIIQNIKNPMSSRWFWLSVFAFVLALLAKPTVTMLPLALIIFDIWPLGRWINDKNKTLFLEKMPYFAIAFASGIITYISQKNTASVDTLTDYPAYTIIFRLFHNMSFYIYKFFVPHDLTPYYAIPNPFLVWNIYVLSGIFLVAVLIFVVAVFKKKAIPILCGFSAFYLLLLPTTGIIGFTSTIASDKYAYFPFLGILIITAYFIRGVGDMADKIIPALYKKWRLPVLIIISIGVLMLYSGLTRSYTYKWKDTQSIYSHALSMAPESLTLNNNYGTYLVEREKFDEAMQYFEMAEKSGGGDYRTYCNMGAVYLYKKQFTEAERYLQKSLEMNPDFTDTYNNYAYVLSSQGKYDEAIGIYEKALMVKTVIPETYFNYALLLEQLEKYAEAEENYINYLKILPYDDGGYKNLGVVYMKMGRGEEARNMFEKSLSINPNQPDLIKYLRER